MTMYCNRPDIFRCSSYAVNGKWEKLYMVDRFSCGNLILTVNNFGSGSN